MTLKGFMMKMMFLVFDWLGKRGGGCKALKEELASLREKLESCTA